MIDPKTLEAMTDSERQTALLVLDEANAIGEAMHALFVRTVKVQLANPAIGERLLQLLDEMLAAARETRGN